MLISGVNVIYFSFPLERPLDESSESEDDVPLSHFQRPALADPELPMDQTSQQPTDPKAEEQTPPQPTGHEPQVKTPDPMTPAPVLPGPKDNQPTNPEEIFEPATIPSSLEQNAHQPIDLEEIDQPAIRCSSPDLTPAVLESRVVKMLLAQNASILAEMRGIKDELKELRCLVAGRRTSPKKQPQYISVDGNDIIIGAIEESVYVMDKEVYHDIWDRVDNAKDFVVKLLPKVFSEQELATSNFNGGRVFNGKEYIVKEALRKKAPFLALMAQAQIEFPTNMENSVFQKQLKDAINGKCRKMALKLRL